MLQFRRYHSLTIACQGSFKHHVRTEVCSLVLDSSLHWKLLLEGHCHKLFKLYGRCCLNRDCRWTRRSKLLLKTFPRLQYLILPQQVIQPTVIADVMFLHERGFYNTLYYFSFFAAVFVCDIGHFRTCWC